MAAILHKQLQLPGKVHRTFQLLSIHSFEKIRIHVLLTETDFKSYIPNKITS